MLLTPPLSQTVTPSQNTSPFERDVLYGRPHTVTMIIQRLRNAQNILLFSSSNKILEF